jgi:hypothetical protein
MKVAVIDITNYNFVQKSLFGPHQELNPGTASKKAAVRPPKELRFCCVAFASTLYY